MFTYDEYKKFGIFSTIRDEGSDPETQRQTAVYISGAPPVWRTPPFPFCMPLQSSELRIHEPARFIRADEGGGENPWKLPLRTLTGNQGHFWAWPFPSHRCHDHDEAP